jgi:hypothetical protein
MFYGTRAAATGIRASNPVPGRAGAAGDRIPPVRHLTLLLALAGCKAFLNKDFTREPAPPIGGGTWIGGGPGSDWQVVTFFAPDRERSIANVPRLVRLRQEFGPMGVAVIAITRAPAAEAKRFAEEHGADYAIEADGSMAFERWGIGSTDHAPVYVIDPNNRVLAEGYDDCAEVLRERLGAPGSPAGAPAKAAPPAAGPVKAER